MWLLCIALIAMVWWRKTRVDEIQRAKREPGKRPVAAVSALASAYAIFSAWTFLAWYRGPRRKPYKWGGDGWMGIDTYVGGADKPGHAWGAMTLARLGTAILHNWGGLDRKKSAIASATASELLFLGIEVKDGFYYEFSYSAMTGTTVGALLAWLLDTYPRIGELFAFRVEYFPSEMYLRKLRGTSPCPPASCSRWNLVEDYSGETFLAALHLGGIRAVRDRVGVASRFVDVAVGFGSRNYHPFPDLDLLDNDRQELWLGLAFNAQGFFDWLLEDTEWRKTRATLHGAFEVLQLPFTTRPLARFDRERAPQRRTYELEREPTTRAASLVRGRSRAMSLRSRRVRSPLSAARVARTRPASGG